MLTFEYFCDRILMYSNLILKGKFQMRKTILSFASGFLAAAMLFVGVFVVEANSNSSMRQVFYGVNVSVNGQLQNFPTDQTPFISDGRTFLPVRGIADALDIPVTWDGSTSTVHVGTQPVGVPFLSTIQHFRENNVVNARLSIGNATSFGISHANALLGNSWSGSFNPWPWREYNLNGQWQTITGDVLRLDRRTSGACTITFIGDGRELLTVTTNNSDQPQPISVDVRGVLVLRIEISSNGTALHNAMIQ